MYVFKRNAPPILLHCSNTTHSRHKKVAVNVILYVNLLWGNYLSEKWAFKMYIRPYYK